MLSPELEKQGILGNTTGRRPGDVPAQMRALVIDHKRAEQVYALTQKHGKYDKIFAETNYSVCAMIWETLGALNSEPDLAFHPPSSWGLSSARTAVALGHAICGSGQLESH